MKVNYFKDKNIAIQELNTIQQKDEKYTNGISLILDETNSEIILTFEEIEEVYFALLHELIYVL